MSNTLVFSGMSRRILVLAAITVGVLFVALIGIRYAAAVVPGDYGLHEGDTVSAAGSDDPDVYIVNELGYKRLFLNPVIFGMYGHLGGFANVHSITPATRDAFPTSGLFRNCETNDQAVYGVETTGEDTGILHWVNTSGAQAVADDANFFKKVFCINTTEFNWYAKGANYTSVNQVPNYVRVPGNPPVTGPLSVALAPDNPPARTITANATGVEFLKVRFSGSGTVNQVVLKRMGAGETDDFTNVYAYDGATRLVSGKTFNSSSGEVTFINLAINVSGTKDITFTGDMAGTTLNEGGNVNAIQLKEVSASGTVSGLPITGNSMASSGATSGTVTVTRSGSIGNPNVGAKNVQLSEFKITTATEGASIRRLTLLQGGSVKAADITNLKLKTGTNEWSGSMTSKGYAVFDLGSGFYIAKGGNAVFSVYGDVAGKKAETIGFYLENDTDTLAIGDQYGQGMAVTDTNFDEYDATNNDEAHYLVLAGGVLTLNFVGPTAGNIGTDTSDTVFLRYSMTSAANIEVRKTQVVLCNTHDGGTTFDNMTAALKFPDLEDVKIVNEDTGAIIVGPADGTAFDTLDTDSCPDTKDGVYELFADTFDIAEGQTLNLKVTADVKTANVATGTVEDIDATHGSKVVVVLEGYGTLASNIANIKYAGTTTAVAATDIAPSTDISGPEMTVQASALTLGLAGTPGDQTFVKGTTNIDMVGITFAAAQASELKVTSITLTGYVDENLEAGTYRKGVDTDDATLTIANAVTNVRLIEAETGNVIAGVDKMSNNSLSVADTGTMKFSFASAPWTIAAGATKTMLVRVDLTNNAVSGTYDWYAFDIAATTDVTALDSSNNTVNGTAAPNGATAPTQVLEVSGSGTMTVAKAPGNPITAGVYWGQTNVPFSKFRITATDEGQYIEKLTIAASTSAAEAGFAKANVKKVYLTYKNKAGSTLTSEQSFTSGASANFGWSYSGSGTDLRPYVPKGSNLDISVAADLRTKDEGATQYDNAAVLFSLDFVDRYNASYTNGFKSVGEGSGAVLDGTATGVNDVTTSNNMYVYRVYPKIDVVALSSPYLLIGTPDVYKFTVTAMGLPDSKLLFDDQDSTNFASGSIKFEVVASGEYTVGGSAYSTSFEVYDESNVLIDSGTLTAGDARASVNASLTFDFSSQDVEITGGGSKTFRIAITNPTVNYSKTTTTGRAADYLQVILRDEAGMINWVGNSAGSTADLDSASVAGVLRNLPATGPMFQR